MTKEDVKKWMEEHEKQIKLGVKIAAGVTLAIVIGKKLSSTKTKVIENTIETTAEEAPKAITAKCRELPLELIKQKFEVYSEGPRWIEFADYGEGIGMTIEEAHRAINAISKIDGFSDETRIQAMFNVCCLDE